MCRNIRTLFNFEPPVTHDEIENASLQYVRKISGFTKPSSVNEKAFYRAVNDISKVSGKLLHSMHTHAHSRNREEEAKKAKERSIKRFGK